MKISFIYLFDMPCETYRTAELDEEMGFVEKIATKVARWFRDDSWIGKFENYGDRTGDKIVPRF